MKMNILKQIKMNFPKSILVIAFVSFLFVGCKEKTNESISASSTDTNPPKVKKEISAANLQKASFTIDGMTCAIGCAKTIE